MVGMTGLISRYTTARVPLAVEKRGYVPSVGVLRNLRARISLKVTAQFTFELRLHNKRIPPAGTRLRLSGLKTHVKRHRNELHF